MASLSLRNLSVKRTYDSNDGIDLVKEFYEPCLSNSCEYRRIAGFFTSSSLAVVARGIANFIINNGRMYLITSPYLSKEDVDAINQGIQNRDEVLTKSLILGLQLDSLMNEHVEALGWMIAHDLLEIRIVVVLNDDGTFCKAEDIDKVSLFHQKIGIFSDSDGNEISFSGSINETASAWTNNIEQFDVFTNWKSSEISEYLDDYKKRFEKYWELGIHNHTLTVEFPEAVKHEWIRHVPIKKEDLRVIKNNAVEIHKYNYPSWFTPRPYQSQAISEWKRNGYHGLFDMATGTGKTLTAMMGIVDLLNYTHGKLMVIITCPYLHLVEMWAEECRYFGTFTIIEAHSQSKGWKEKLTKGIELFKRKQSPVIIVSTINTFVRIISERISEVPGNVLVVSDEVHRMGSEANLRSLSSSIQYRLGLSATIDRKNDPFGTQKIREYFGPTCIEYSLDQAISDGMLVPYYYYPLLCYYSDSEYDKMVRINREIDELSKIKTISNLNKIKQLKVNGYTVMAKMDDKLETLNQMLIERKEEFNTLVYCGATSIYGEGEIDVETGHCDESIRLIEYIVGNIHRCGIDVRKFTCDESLKQRKEIIEDFCNKKIQIIAAIRCLDEGVNIPDIKTAYILSSSEDPKEYIQRRGRVLRQSKGKEYAVIYDFLAMPPSFRNRNPGSNEDMELRLIARELKRAFAFGDSSLNPELTNEISAEVAERYKVSNIRRYVDECQ